MNDFPPAATDRTDQAQRRAEDMPAELRAALDPYLERHDGDTASAVRELLTDLRFAAAADGTDFDTAAEAVLARTSHDEPTGDGHG